ncbi:MAG TPA: C45 family autoproteolytic acyltransferase/hydrolase [Terriglobia bacterium]|nr:C45 family autoproteolytic acyltransferase/hydrolase [Terriglobia bacterium]
MKISPASPVTGLISVALNVRGRMQVVCLAACLFVPVVALATTPLYQSSFRKPHPDGTAARGLATPDASVLHDSNPSLRIEREASSEDACIRLAPVSLTLGHQYELSGWARTEGLEVRDLDRSPIASGATLTMASMPFDVHSASLGGTQPWTRLSIRFVASRTHDQILLTVGNGGAFSGKAWFEGIRLEEASSADVWPIREAVQTFGPAYRYPAAGWIYLHIEGEPYERGYQHGHLMAREIPEYLERCAASLGEKGHWDHYRTTANALFLRGFDREILEEMRGIAEGAADAGARWQGRRIDLTDIVVANVTVEMGELAAAVSTTPTGLEGLGLDRPPYAEGNHDSKRDHCSAFAATGPATPDGKMVIGHVTWWPLDLAEQTNVWLDIKPASGHRILIQSYPGGIESGTDWYQNDAGVVVTETTIDQTPFNIQGTPVAFRARMAIQYSSDIDGVVRYLGTGNNGLYTNEWIIGDAKTNEIAIYDLGTHHTRLWRSSKNEWFGDTPGFYWGDNNAKDLSVRLENYPDPQGDPDYIPYVPGPRDLAWQKLYRDFRGRIDEQFGFLAFRTAPLVSSSTMDAKVTTSDMASHLMVWAAFGKPNQREWLPHNWDYAKDDGLYPSGYYLFAGEPTEALRAAIQQNETARRSAMQEPAGRQTGEGADPPSYEGRLWKGWILPASDADVWFVAGSAEYRSVLQAKDPEEAIDAQRAIWRGLELSPDAPENHFRRERVRGVLFLDSLRRRMGDDAFLKMMNDYFAAYTTRPVTGQSFLAKAGAAMDPIDPPAGPAYLAGDIMRRLASAVIVYGTAREAGANRYAAEQIQNRFLDRYESRVRIYKDFEAPEDLLRHCDVVFVGRPEANSALSLWAQRLGLSYNSAAFRINGETHASEREGLIFAAKNPLDPAHMVLVVAGNGALSTIKTQKADLTADEFVIIRDGEQPIKGFVKPDSATGSARMIHPVTSVPGAGR